MKQHRFEKEVDRRLEENKNLSQRQIIPQRLFAPATIVINNMFVLMLVGSFLVTLVGFSLWGSQLMGLSRKMLGL